MSDAAKERLEHYVQSVSRQSAGTMKNLSNTTVVSEQYRQAVDKTVLAVSSGLGDYQSATRSIVQNIGYNGMQVQYESGHKRRLDTAVRQNVIDGTKQIMQHGSDIMGEELGYAGLITLTCYDAMLKTNQSYLGATDTELFWPKTMVTCVNEIAERIGSKFDSRTILKTGDDYKVTYPSGLTMQQVLGYIGACNGGNWIITEDNLLRLVPLVTIPDETNYIVDYDYERIKTAEGHLLVHKASDGSEEQTETDRATVLNVPIVLGSLTNGSPITVTAVSGANNDGTSYTAGDASKGVTLDIGSNPYVTQSMVASIISAMVNNPQFSDAIKTKIGLAVDTLDLEKEMETLQSQLHQAAGTKSRLERQMDSLDVNDPFYSKKISDLQRRYDEQYGKIDEIEIQIDDVQNQIRTIRQEKISGDNIYHLLLAFDQVYGSASEVERKEFMRAFIERIELYPEKQPDGNWIRKIVFNFPVPVNGEEVDQLPLEDETILETVVLMSRKDV